MVVAAAVSAVVLGPALAPGVLLHYDLVSVPRPVLDDDALGLGDRLPRAVPWDSAVALAAHVLPGGVAVQLAALAALTLAGAGAVRLAEWAGTGRWITLLVAIWNPFVLEQLAIGHVPHLLAYGALPWVLLSARRSVAAGPAALAPLVVAAAAGSLTPGGGVLCVLTAIAGAATGARERACGDALARAVLAVGAVVVLQAPWVVAGLMHLASATTSGAHVFATRAETPAGVVVDVLGLGGMWAGGSLPASRSTPLALAATALLLALAAAGARQAARRPLAPAVAALAVLGYAVALLPHAPGGATLLDALALHVPGAGLLRDGHRWLAWPALALAVLAGSGAGRLGARAAPRLGGSPGPVLALVAAAVVAVLPDLAWGLQGRLATHRFPPDWDRVRAVLDAAPDADRVLLLPWQPFRRFAWSGAAPVLDPAPRFLPRPTLVDDALTVDGIALPPEGPGARALTAALEDGGLDADELARLGVGWVLVERGTQGEPPAVVAPGDLVVDGPDLALLRLRAPASPVPVDPVRRRAVTAAHLCAGALVVVAIGGHAAVLLRRRVRRRRLLAGNVR